MMENLHYLPLINFLLLVPLTLIAAWLFVASRRWTTPAQDTRLTAIEHKVDYDEHRIKNLEDGARRTIRDFFETNATILKEIKHLSEQVAEISKLNDKVRVLEDVQSDQGQQIQFLTDLGCGHPECPRINNVEGKE